MVACPLTRRLYVADLSNNCVWRIDLDSADPDRAARRWIPNRLAPGAVRPFSLSLRFGRLLVTSYNRLSLYDQEGRLLRQVTAIFSNRKRFWCIFIWKLKGHNLMQWRIKLWANRAPPSSIDQNLGLVVAARSSLSQTRGTGSFNLNP